MTSWQVGFSTVIVIDGILDVTDSRTGLIKTPASKVLCPLDFGVRGLFSQRFSDFWRLHQLIPAMIPLQLALTRTYASLGKTDFPIFEVLKSRAKPG